MQIQTGGKKYKPKQTLSTSFCQLMEQYPLTHARIKNGNRFTLSVLLIGTGEGLEQLRDKVMANGQLLDTYLLVNIASPVPEDDRRNLLDKAQDLRRFFRISGEPEDMLEDDWGTLTYHPCNMTAEGLTAIGDVLEECTYVLISTGDYKVNRKLAEMICPKDDRMVAYVQNSKTLRCTQEKNVVSDPGIHDDGYWSQMEAVAYNLHYAYMRGNDPHVSTGKIEKTFYDEYNYESNFECALHIRSKLQCCDIDTTYLKQAVEQFAKKLEKDHAEGRDQLLNQLAQLEHRRWCVSKLLQKFVKPDSLDQIYSAPKVTTHSKDDKWHIALVPYFVSGKYRSHLEEKDWITDDPKQIHDLDPLDRQTLLVHQKCGEIMKQTSGSCQDAINRIKELAADRRTKNLACDLEVVLRDLLNGKKSAIRIYEQCSGILDDMLKDKKDDDLTELQKLLQKLRRTLGAWVEYVTQKDYKEQNRVLVRQIPFALSVGRSMVLVKLMSDDDDECVSAVWNLEPSRLLFLDFADSMDDLVHIRRRSQRLNRFLGKHCANVSLSYHIYVSGEVADIKDSYEEFFRDWDCHIQPVLSGNADHIRPWFVSLIDKYHVNYIDLTGGKPELIGVAEEYARNSHVGTFVIRDGKLRNYYGAIGLKDQPLNKSFSVGSMFERKNARKKKDDDSSISSEILKKYEAFWLVAHHNTENWYNFCVKFFAPAYREMLSVTKAGKQLPLDIPKKYFTDRVSSMNDGSGDLYLNILDQLCQSQLVHLDQDVYRIASEDILSALRNSGKVLEYCIYCAAREQFGSDHVSMSWLFSHDATDKESAQNEVDVICTTDTGSLFISAKNVSLQTVKKGNFLNYVCYEVSELAEHFGINAKKVLAAPNVPQFGKDHQLSELVRHAMKRGVYLLGDACFASNGTTFSSDKLRQVLDNIARGEENWCECLLDTVTAK